jgi:hypothetical protein
MADGSISEFTATRVLKTGSRRLNDTSDPGSLSSRFRRARDRRLRALIAELSASKGAISILDLGGSVQYWRRVGLDFLREHGAKITVLNIVETELKLGASEPDLFIARVGDGCDLSDMADGQFDLVHSNSVIEHVGNWARMKQFAAETRRVGRSYYVQTPYYWFPVDPHYYRLPMIHWLPRPIQARLLARVPIASIGRIGSLDAAFKTLDGTQLLDRHQFEVAFPDATLVRERVAGLIKSLVAVRQVSS